MAAALTDTVDRAAPATGSATVPIRAAITAHAGRGTAALPATGEVRGVIAATRRITAGSPAAAGNRQRIRGRAIGLSDRAALAPRVMQNREPRIRCPTD